MSAAEAFGEALGRAPEGVWSAPGRVNLIGEHTDYNGGYVLPFAIDMRTTVAASTPADGVLRIRSVQKSAATSRSRSATSSPAPDLGWAGYVAGVVWALRKVGHDIGGMEVLIDGKVPTGAGLSSSAALECSVGAAALDLHGIVGVAGGAGRALPRAPRTTSSASRCGLMDQMASSVCRAGHALFFDIRDDVREQVPSRPTISGWPSW